MAKWKPEPTRSKRRLGDQDTYELPPERRIKGFRSNWSTAHVERRGAQCQDIYDKATALQKKNRKGSYPACSDERVAEAVLKAFTGPCKRAKKAYQKAMKSCKRG